MFVFRNFVLPQYWKGYGLKVTAVSVTGAALFSLSISTVSGLLTYTVYRS